VRGHEGRDHSIVGWSGTECVHDGMAPSGPLEVAVDVGAQEDDVAFGLGAHLLHQHLSLVAMVEGFDGLLEADGDEQADADGGDVDEEVAPGVGGFVGWVDVEHGRVLSGVGRCGAEMQRGARFWFEDECIVGAPSWAWLRMKR